MENGNNRITRQMVAEALEQVRASFTVSRMAFGAITILFPLKKKDEKWAKKFTKIQNQYHKFLLDSYKELEEELPNVEIDEGSGV